MPRGPGYAPLPWAPVLVYIYTRTPRALRARSVLVIALSSLLDAGGSDSTDVKNSNPLTPCGSGATSHQPNLGAIVWLLVIVWGIVLGTIWMIVGRRLGVF